MKHVLLTLIASLIFGSLAWGQCNQSCQNQNTAFGYNAGNAGNAGFDNSFFGENAGSNMSSGFSNAFFGTNAGQSTSTGTANAFFGSEAGKMNVGGSNNAFFGTYSGQNNTSGSDNAFFGESAGNANTTGSHNVFLGYHAGYANTTAISNSFVGYESGSQTTSGSYNSFFGLRAGFSNTTGWTNTCFGADAGRSFTNAFANAFFGQNAGFSHVSGNNNSFFGQQAGFQHVSGGENTFIGQRAGTYNVNGSGNVFLGYNAGGNETGSNKLYIANSITSDPLIYGDFTQGRIGINNGNPEHELHIKDNDNNVTMFLQPGQWNPVGEARIIMGSNFHYIQVKREVGMTLGDYDGIQFQTRDQEGIPILATRMVIDRDGKVGIGTTTPSAIFHTDGNVRLQNLPSNTGGALQVLLVDNDGNVFKGQSTQNATTAPNPDNLLEKVEALERRIQELEAKLANSSTSPYSSQKAQLYQNQPNPFDRSTSIELYLPARSREAVLFIYDFQGNQVQKLAISERGEAQIDLEAGSLPAGVYHYALVVDGQEVAMKRMLITE